MKKLILEYLRNATAYKQRHISEEDLTIKFKESSFCLVKFQLDEWEWKEAQINIWDVLVYVNSKLKNKTK